MKKTWKKNDKENSTNTLTYYGTYTSTRKHHTTKKNMETPRTRTQTMDDFLIHDEVETFINLDVPSDHETETDCASTKTTLVVAGKSKFIAKGRYNGDMFQKNEKQLIQHKQKKLTAMLDEVQDSLDSLHHSVLDGLHRQQQVYAEKMTDVEQTFEEANVLLDKRNKEIGCNYKRPRMRSNTKKNRKCTVTKQQATTSPSTQPSAPRKTFFSRFHSSPPPPLPTQIKECEDLLLQATNKTLDKSIDAVQRIQMSLLETEFMNDQMEIEMQSQTQQLDKIEKKMKKNVKKNWVARRKRYWLCFRKRYPT